MIDILQRNLGCSFEDAAAEAIAMRDRVMNLFLALRDRLMRGASPALQSYLMALGHGIRSNIDWSLTVPRYTRVKGEGDQLGSTIHIKFAGDCVDHPSDTSFDPLPFPAIAWWWDQFEVR